MGRCHCRRPVDFLRRDFKKLRQRLHARRAQRRQRFVFFFKNRFHQAQHFLNVWRGGVGLFQSRELFTLPIVFGHLRFIERLPEFIFCQRHRKPRSTLLGFNLYTIEEPPLGKLRVIKIYEYILD